MTPRPVRRTPGSVAAACTADYACTIFPTKTLSDPGACGVTNRRGIKLCHQILTSNYARTDQLHGGGRFARETRRARHDTAKRNPPPPGQHTRGSRQRIARAAPPMRVPNLQQQNSAKKSFELLRPLFWNERVHTKGVRRWRRSPGPIALTAAWLHGFRYDVREMVFRSVSWHECTTACGSVQRQKSQLTSSKRSLQQFRKHPLVGGGVFLHR